MPVKICRHCYRKTLFYLILVCTTLLVVFIGALNLSADRSAGNQLKAVSDSTIIAVTNFTAFEQEYVQKRIAVNAATAAAANDEQILFEKHNFNADLSNRISSLRSIPDTRENSCKQHYYSIDVSRKASVIITFHNEARSTLLRTIASILKRTPLSLLEEIILIDDFSDDESDGQLLITIEKVKLFRNEKREGLIRSRNSGVIHASGHYVIFMDSHCEVNVQWLEPLLERLATRPKTVLCPTIDVIDQSSLEYKGNFVKMKGGFDWGLHFKWILLKSNENTDTKPFETPIVPGGIFMVARDWFMQLGGFDNNLEIWGGEALDFSLKAWTCGGALEIVPCSRIGHIYMKKHPYSFPAGVNQTIIKNLKRIAERWLHEFKSIFYAERPTALLYSIPPETYSRHKLVCHNFTWYIKNIYKELELPNQNHIAYGHLQHDSRCLSVDIDDKISPIHLSECLDLHSTKWTLNKDSCVLSTTSGACLSVSKKQLVVEYCRDTVQQEWQRIGSYLKHRQTSMCLESLEKKTVGVSECRPGASSQLWNFSIEYQKL